MSPLFKTITLFSFRMVRGDDSVFIRIELTDGHGLSSHIPGWPFKFINSMQSIRSLFLGPPALEATGGSYGGDTTFYIFKSYYRELVKKIIYEPVSFSSVSSAYLITVLVSTSPKVLKSLRFLADLM